MENSVNGISSTTNILLVDDRPADLLALETILSDLGQNLVKAASGADALQHLLRQDFAVILLDVQMPGMDGFETATLIRQRERSQHTPIIFVTGMSKADLDIISGYTVGAVDYIIKPVAPQILKSKVRAFVDLFQMGEQIKRQSRELQAVNERLAAANVLGVERSQLVKKPVTRFIVREDQDIYYLHRQKLFETRARQVWELRMVRADDGRYDAGVEQISKFVPPPRRAR